MLSFWCMLTKPIPFIMEVHAFDLAIGSILSHTKDNKKLNPITFHSWKCETIEINNRIHEKESRTIVDTFNEWCQIADGGCSVFRCSRHILLLTWFFFLRTTSRLVCENISLSTLLLAKLATLDTYHSIATNVWANYEQLTYVNKMNCPHDHSNSLVHTIVQVQLSTWWNELLKVNYIRWEHLVLMHNASC